MSPSTPIAVRLVATVAALIVVLAIPAAGSAREMTGWGTATPLVDVNSAQADGCPIESPNGLRLYFASTRPGAVGGAGDPRRRCPASGCSSSRRAVVKAPAVRATSIAPGGIRSGAG